MMKDLQPSQQYEDFGSAAEVALGLLREKVGLQFWMITRLAGDELIVLNCVGNSFGVKNGDSMLWSDTLCSRMLAGSAPRVAPRVSEIGAYANAPLTQALHIGAYMGAPLTLSDGKLYGTLAGMDREPKRDDLKAQQWLVEMVAGLLGAIVSREKSAGDSATQLVSEGGEVLVDKLTQTFNRRAWDRILVAEEARCARHNHSACVICVDIDSLRATNDAQGRDKGDELLVRTSQVLKRACRGYDVVARTGEDEFAILAVECGLKGAKGMFDRINGGFHKENIKASLGIALRNASTGLPRTFEEATNTLLNAKRSRT
ncbi:MAG TPA: sensor domain-containing diguanylate cyclase [Candidatus Acidoferrales bacterium]|nr:sensor domain-containing diguanylate cyclase [Candidatus Acidoferrales bacterium]